MATPAWATPTRRAMRWRPFLAAAAGVLAVVVALGAADAPAAAEPLVLVLVAMLVGSAALALDDPAHSLVAAAPVGFTRRLAHRVAWLGPALIGCACAIGWVALRFDAIAEHQPMLLAWCAALGSIALVTHVLVARTSTRAGRPCGRRDAGRVGRRLGLDVRRRLVRVRRATVARPSVDDRLLRRGRPRHRITASLISRTS